VARIESAPENLVTERLVGARVTDAHTGFLISMWQDPQVAAWLGRMRTADELTARVAGWDRGWNERGYGVWVFSERSTGEPVGYAGLAPTSVGGEQNLELLYGLASVVWGRGLGTEMAEAVVAVAFEALGRAELVCYTMTTNEASRRVMAKAGFVFETELMHAGSPHRFSRLARPSV
jgi:ribosomal-protein-alanine N-acetyltransferase